VPAILGGGGTSITRPPLPLVAGEPPLLLPPPPAVGMGLTAEVPAVSPIDEPPGSVVQPLSVTDQQMTVPSIEAGSFIGFLLLGDCALPASLIPNFDEPHGRPVNLGREIHAQLLASPH